MEGSLAAARSAALFGRKGYGFMRDIFYTEQEIRESFDRWNPRLHQYALDCREARPIPDRHYLTSVDEAKLNILIDGVAEIRDRQPYCRAPHTRIVHGSELTLLAFQEVFQSDDARWLSLLSEEWLHWRDEVFSGAYDWFSSNLATLDESIPDGLVEYYDGSFPDGIVESIFKVPRVSRCWLLKVAFGGYMRHELWVWHKCSASRLGVISESVEG